MTIETDKPIDLLQLTQEVGSDCGLSMRDDGTIRTITCCEDGCVTEEQLQVAVDNHVPAPPAPEVRVEDLLARIEELEARLAAQEAPPPA